MLPIYNTGNNPSTTLNQAALGNQMGSYGQAGNYGLQGGLGTYLGDSIGGYLKNGLFNGNWKDVAGAFGDKGATYAGGSGSITGFDSGLGAVAGFAGGLLDRSAAHQRTSGKYGHVAQSVDTVANVVGSVGNYNPLATGLGRLGMGAINKVTGGTDGMTVQDSLLGSSAIQGTLTGIAAASGPIGWGIAGAYALASGINAATGKTTTDNAYKSFMDKDKLADVSSGYTDMDLENEAQQLYNKKYGGFSRGAYKKAQKKINQAQMRMTDKIDIRDTAELGQIRAGMVDANNMRYQMSINGGYKPLAIGRDGLKITPERLKEAKEIAKCIRKKRSAKFNVIPEEAREAMRDVTKVPNDAIPFFQEGGQMNVIPEGSLHARLHHMEDDEHITKKGIPVVDLNGKQQAEIERNEIIFRKEVTAELEKLFRDGSDEAAIEAGKLLAKEIIENTDDRTGLIEEVTGEPKLNHEVIPSAKLGATLGGLLKEGTTKEDIMGIVQKGIDVFKSGKEAKKKEQEIQDKLNQKNLENSLKVSESFAEQNQNIMNNGPAEVATTENGYVATTKPLPEVTKPEISNTTDKSLQDLIAEYIKNNELKTDNAPTSNSISNLAALIQGAQDLYKTKKKADETKDGDNPTEVPSTATPTLTGKDYALNAQEGEKLPEFKTFKDLQDYLNKTGRGSDKDYDLESAYNDPEIYGYWREEESKSPGNGHWLDKYKKPSHITYSTDSIFGDSKQNGGMWTTADGEDLFIVSPYLENLYSLNDYLNYFKTNEPNAKFRYKGVTYSTKRRKKK